MHHVIWQKIKPHRYFQLLYRIAFSILIYFIIVETMYLVVTVLCQPKQLWWFVIVKSNKTTKRRHFELFTCSDDCCCCCFFYVLVFTVALWSHTAYKTKYKCRLQHTEKSSLFFIVWILGVFVCFFAPFLFYFIHKSPEIAAQNPKMSKIACSRQTVGRQFHLNNLLFHMSLHSFFGFGDFILLYRLFFLC